MIGIDTNILIYARLSDNPFQAAASRFLDENACNPEVVISELVLIELYVALRNPAIVSPALDAPAAVEQCEIFRRNPHWQLIEEARVMDSVWKEAAISGFPRRRIFDLRLAKTLIAHGVTDFATANTKDFIGQGFQRVWNPLLEL